ncbi:sensor histidine kinase [Streptomyces sp. NBRC 109706]|uniref:sensor histidine kinase n=1 Tax=Streptomyces sp. NBRC 109706 TaxID=1550035 RepID=UPI000781F466|nr:sensor histidine kinase [Streptomyces sp. NBRC 109706]
MRNESVAEGESAPRVSGGAFFRWGPFPLLALGALLAWLSADSLMTATERWLVWPLGALTLAEQIRWSLRSRRAGTSASGGAFHYTVRSVLAAALTWLNPLFAVYATLGYFDAHQLLPPRWARVGLIATAVTMAGSQSGGLPPDGWLGWVLFGALLAVHIGLLLILSRLTLKDAERTRANEATIVELGRANARLAQTLDENAGLHAQLLVQAREAGVLDERRRLAAEIHDTLAQGLAGIVTQLEAAVEARPAEKDQRIERAAALARDALAEARRSVHDLGPVALDQDPLPSALAKTTAEWSREAGVPAAFSVTGPAEPLHPEVAATLLRIAQEALTNVERHAGASRVGVTLSYMDDEVSLDVRDDGRGFVPPSPAAESAGQVPGHGFGLHGMRSRAARLAGAVAVETEPGGGTAVSARVPLVRRG